MAGKTSKTKGETPAGRFKPDLSAKITFRCGEDFLARISAIGARNNFNEAETTRFLIEAAIAVAEEPTLGMPEIIRLRQGYFLRTAARKK